MQFRWVPIVFVIGLLLTSYAEAGKKEEVAYKQAELMEFDDAGHEMNNIFAHSELVMNRISKRVSSFDLTQSFGPPPCLPGNVCIMMASWMSAFHFIVVAQRRDRCGSTRYLGIQATQSRRNPPIKFEVVDHSTRQCDDYQKFEWEVTLTSQDSIKHYSGNPARLEDIAECLEKIDQTMCIMIFQPTECVSQTVDGGTTRIVPISAPGSNSCEAITEIKRQACRRGIQSDRFKDEDIMCAFTITMHDPIPVPSP